MFSKIFGLWGEYKWGVVAIVFLVISVFTWNISSSVKDNEFNAERIRLRDQTIEALTKNDQLKADITRNMIAQLGAFRDELKISQKVAVDEIFKDPRYKSCIVTDGVRNAYTSAIRAQPALRGNDGTVPAPKRTTVQ